MEWGGDEAVGLPSRCPSRLPPYRSKMQSSEAEEVTDRIRPLDVTVEGLRPMQALEKAHQHHIMWPQRVFSG